MTLALQRLGASEYPWYYLKQYLKTENTWTGRSYCRGVLQKQAEAKQLPTTTQPTPADFEDVYRNALEDEDDDIIAILISEKLSGTFQSATIAKQSFDRNIYIVDSGTTTIGLRILVERAVYLRNQGLKTKEVVDILERKKQYKTLCLCGYTGISPKGRSPLKRSCICRDSSECEPLISLADGTLHACGKARGIKKAYSQVIELANADGIDFSRHMFGLHR